MLVLFSIFRYARTFALTEDVTKKAVIDEAAHDPAFEPDFYTTRVTSRLQPEKDPAAPLFPENFKYFI